MEPGGEPSPGERLRRRESNGTLYFDFDSVAVLNVWVRHQKSDIGIARVLMTSLTQILINIMEISLFFCIIVGLILDDRKTKAEEISCTVLLWIITTLFTVLLKIFFQRNLRKPTVFCSNQVGGLWNAVLLIMKPLKYFRSIYHRACKLTVLGKEFIHGETVTREQFEYIIRINREELVDARDDLHDAYLHRIPMAFLYFYYFSHSPSAPQICSLIDGCRCLIAILHLISSIQSAIIFEWKQLIYLDSVHVQGYLKTNGRYSVPEWTEGHLTHLLKVLSLSTSLLSRFFLIAFAARLGCGHGIACLLILFIANWIIIIVYPSALPANENLPLGVSIPASYIVDRWISTFSGLTTRFNELSKYPLEVGSCSSRFPLVFTQVFNFVLAFSLLFCFVGIMQLASHAPKTNNTVIDVIPMINDTSYTNDTANATMLDYDDDICDNVEKWSPFFQYLSLSMSSIVQFLNVVCHDPRHSFFGALHIHWTLFYIHIIVTLIYNYLVHFYIQKDNYIEFYPPMVALCLYKCIFRKLFESRQAQTYKDMVCRFLFLVGVDLEKFYQIHFTYKRGEGPHEVTSARWWEERMVHVLERYDPGKTRYRDSPSTPNLTTLPIGLEIHAAYAAIKHLRYSYRLYLFCGNRIDECVTKEMTSGRLEATLEMMQMSKEELLSELENSIATDD